jgi:hypothetical protein
MGTKANTIQLVLEVDDRGSAKVTKFSSNLTDQVRRSSESAAQSVSGAAGQMEMSFGRLIAKIGGITVVLATVKTAITATRDYLVQIETATLGIAAAFMTGGKYIDATTGKALAAQESLRAAQDDSANLIKELQYANLQTIATLDQLIVAYQQTLPVAIARGFDTKMVKEFTVAMVQAAGAIGLPMEQLAEETRSLLTGAINPRNSRIATVLGLRNEDIAEYKNNASGLFEFLMGKLASYRVAGIEAQKTWAGLMSNVKDISLQFLGQAGAPLFEAVKYEIQEITSSMVTLDEKTKTIKWNPEFISGIESLKSGITAAIAESYRFGMFLDKVGGSLTRFAFGATLGAVMPWGEGLYQRNQEWLARYDASNKALQDLAMRSMGWKPMTPDMQLQIQSAVKEGKKIADTTWMNIGGDGDGTRQLLYYYRPIAQKTNYQQQKKDDEDQIAVRKSALETMKKLNKDYFKDQEAEIKFAGELAKSSSADAYLAERATHEKRLALTAEYYARTKAEIQLEAEARSAEDAAKVSAATFVAEKMKVLDAERLSRLKEIGREHIAAEIQIAQADVKSLGERLRSYKQYYDSLKGMIEKNAEQEKKHIEELNALYRQRADLQKSTAGQIRSLQEIGMTPGQKYQSQKTAIDDQYMAALKLSGQEQIKALEEYKQSLVSFGQSWSQGVIETEQNIVFGTQTNTIMTGKRIIDSVISDIEAATNLQRQALDGLAIEKQKQIEADRAWGDVLKQSAEEAVASIRSIQSVIAELEAQIAAMQKVVTISGNDQVTPVVNDISMALAGLHDKTINITTVYRSIGGSGGGELILPSQTAAAGGEPPIASYATGTPYVPRTGLYRLHQGEIVVPEQASAQLRRQSVLRGAAGSLGADDYEAAGGDSPSLRNSDRQSVERYRDIVRTNNYFPSSPAPAPAAAGSRPAESRTVRIGDIHIHLPESAAPRGDEDWRYIVRTFVRPELEKIGHA